IADFAPPRNLAVAPMRPLSLSMGDGLPGEPKREPPCFHGGVNHADISGRFSKEGIMTKRTVLAVLLVLGKGISIASAASGNVSGPALLALAGVVAPHSPVLSSAARRVMARLFAGNPISFPPGRKISVAANSIDCRIGTADITSRTCDLAFEDRRRGER